MKLGLQLGYWGSLPRPDTGDLVRAAEDCGFDSLFTAEAYGSDAFTPLAWWGRETTKLRLGTSIAQLAGRTPTSMAMHALTLDHLSGGRFMLGLGVSGPQVVEGWYGQPFPRPLARTREAVDIIRQVLAREEPVSFQGDHYRLPYDGPGATGLGKPLKSIVHPLRADLPILLGAEGPKNVAQTAEIADGWLPLFFVPGAAAQFNAWLDEGFARPGARRTRETFEIHAMCQLHVTDDPQPVIDLLKPMIALYMGGMGAKNQNFHKDVFDRLGYADVTEKVQELYLAGNKAEAIGTVPDSLVDDLNIIGDAAKVRDKVAEWEEAGATSLLVAFQSVDDIRNAAEVVLG